MTSAPYVSAILSLAASISICTKVDLRIRLTLHSPLELVGEVNIVKECPGVVELAVPSPLQVPHGANHAIYLFVPDKC